MLRPHPYIAIDADPQRGREKPRRSIPYLIQIKERMPRPSFNCAMENEAWKLRLDLERYRFLLRDVTDPRANAAIRELIAEAETRLREITSAAKG